MLRQPVLAALLLLATLAAVVGWAAQRQGAPGASYSIRTKLMEAHGRCQQHKAGAHLPDMALPAWFSFDNWPQMRDSTEERLPMHPYTGQDKEDQLAYEHFFWKKANGTYLEMGALDGQIFSNTNWFWKTLGWTGVLIEANPDAYKQLVANRPNDINLHVAVCANFTRVHYRNDGPTGGIWEFMSPSFRQQWQKNVTVDKLPVVQCMPLTPLLAKFNVRHVNFWSLDVEGGELEVLKTVDFDCISFDVIVVEADGHSPEKDDAVRALLLSKGFELYLKSKGSRSSERNDWFVHRSYVASRRPVVVGGAADAPSA